MNAIGVRLQALGASLIEATRRRDEATVREIAEALFDLGGEMNAREGWARLGRRASSMHATRSAPAMLVWRIKQQFRARPF